MLADLLKVVPELQVLADIKVRVLFNKDSCRVGPKEWIAIAKALHEARYDSLSESR